jgi:hypothetical protein
LRDPLFVRARFVSASAQHGDLMIHGWARKPVGATAG